MACRRLSRLEGASKIHREHPVPLLRGVIHGGLDDVDARIANDVIELPESLHGSINERDSGCWIRHVAARSDHIRATTELLTQRLNCVLGLLIVIAVATTDAPSSNNARAMAKPDPAA